MKKQTKKLDRTDCRIIELLQHDGRIPNTEIAKVLGISEATVRTRLNRLIKEDFIQIVAVSNPLKLGFEIVGIIKIQPEITKLDHVIEKLKEIKAIWFIVQATGPTGIYTEFVVDSTEALNDLLYNQIYRIEGIKQTETSVILNYHKRKYDWGTAMEK